MREPYSNQSVRLSVHPFIKLCPGHISHYWWRSSSNIWHMDWPQAQFVQLPGFECPWPLTLAVSPWIWKHCPAHISITVQGTVVILGWSCVPSRFWVPMTFDLGCVTLNLKTLSGPYLYNCTRYSCHIRHMDRPQAQVVHRLGFECPWPLTLVVWPWTWNLCPAHISITSQIKVQLSY